MIFKGNNTSIRISNKDLAMVINRRFNWAGHTHLGDTFNGLIPSDSDFEVLKILGQKRGIIYSSICMHYILRKMTYEIKTSI